jgi:hypothetical protein
MKLYPILCARSKDAKSLYDFLQRLKSGEVEIESVYEGETLVAIFTEESEETEETETEESENLF